MSNKPEKEEKCSRCGKMEAGAHACKPLKNYAHLSHSHCFENKTPPCGLSGHHCCLCDIVTSGEAAKEEKCDYGKHDRREVEGGERCVKCKTEFPSPTWEGELTGWRKQFFLGMMRLAMSIDKEEIGKEMDNLKSVVDDGLQEAREEAIEIVKKHTPNHITRDYRSTDLMRDEIICELSSLKSQ